MKQPWFLCLGRLADDVVAFLLLDLDDVVAFGGDGGGSSALNLLWRSCSVGLSINVQLLGPAYACCSKSITQHVQS